MTTMTVSLDRNIPVPGIDYRPTAAYRMIGEPGYLDFLLHGEIRASQDRGKYAETYFAVGLASSRYRRRSTRFDYAAEVRDPALMVLAGGGRPRLGDYVRATRTMTAADVTIYRIDNHTGDVRIIHSPTNV